MFFILQQNSVNPATGLDRCWIIRQSLHSQSIYILLLLCFFWISPSSAGSESSGPSSMFSGVFIAEEVDGVGDKGSGDATVVDVRSRVQKFPA